MNEQKDQLGVCYPKGFKAAGVKAGIKKSGNLDVALIVCDHDATSAGVFTTNSVSAACVGYTCRNMKETNIRAVVANAGCANACTGEVGERDVQRTADEAAKLIGCDPRQIGIASTGVIGVPLPMDKMLAGVRQAAAELSAEGSHNAAQAIITTDTHTKELVREYEIGGAKVRFGAIAKGSGMICPNMATMLAFITTDAVIDASVLQAALSETVKSTFNMISVDGDMSTNDMVLVMASNEAGNTAIDKTSGEDYEGFRAALREICEELAKSIAADGEGATKFLTVNVKGAYNERDAKAVAMSVAKSPLVKTAFFGEDPNWGRVVCAVGYTQTEGKIDPEKITADFGGIPVYAGGVGAKNNPEELKKVMAAHDITININLNAGDSAATVWTCDMSYEYVKINGEYHT